MDTVQRFFQPADLEAIRAAVSEAEQRTAGEIVTDDGGSGATALVEFLASKKFI